MTETEATLIAASIAALATLATLIVTIFNQRGQEMRTAHREVIAADLKAVGRAVHEVIALSNIQLKNLDSDRHANCYRAAVNAAKTLKDLRLDVRYTLWGLDGAFRELARLPDWIGHAKPSPQVASELFDAGNKLGDQIDLAVRKAYISGSQPGHWRLWRVRVAAEKFRKVYSTYSASRAT